MAPTRLPGDAFMQATAALFGLTVDEFFDTGAEPDAARSERGRIGPLPMIGTRRTTTAIAGADRLQDRSGR